MKRGFASDIDGTLWFGKVKKEDVEAIRNYQSQGYLFGICSGRPITGVLEMADYFQPDFYIATSGAVILNKDKEIVKEETISYNTVADLYHRYKNALRIVYQTNERDIDILKPRAIETLKKVKLYGVSFVLDSEKTAHHMCEEINKQYQDVIGFQNKASVDITSRACSKGKAIDFIKDYYGIEEISGIGDSYNDIPMLKGADISFVVNNPGIKADYHVAGVCQAIDILFKERGYSNER